MSLPYPNMDFTPLDTLTAEEMNHIVANIESLFGLIYPVGSIYMSATMSTPEQVASAFGGTWVAWGAGRVPVGVDTSQTEFDTVEETGGEKKHIRLLYKKCLAIRIASIEVIMEMRVLKKYHTLMVTIRNGQVRRSNRQEADKPIIISSHTLLVICTSEPHRNKLRDWGLFFLPMPFVFFRDREVDTRNP